MKSFFFTIRTIPNIPTGRSDTFAKMIPTPSTNGVFYPLVRDFNFSIFKSRVLFHTHFNIHQLAIAGSLNSAIMVNLFVSSLNHTRHISTSGDIAYKAESGNDDVVMTTITLSTCFDNVGYKNLIDLYVNNDLQGDVLRYVENITNKTNNTAGLIGAYNRVYRRRPEMYNNRYPS